MHTVETAKKVATPFFYAALLSSSATTTLYYDALNPNAKAFSVWPEMTLGFFAFHMFPAIYKAALNSTRTFKIKLGAIVILVCIGSSLATRIFVARFASIQDTDSGTNLGGKTALSLGCFTMGLSFFFAYSAYCLLASWTRADSIAVRFEESVYTDMEKL